MAKKVIDRKYAEMTMHLDKEHELMLSKVTRECIEKNVDRKTLFTMFNGKWNDAVLRQASVIAEKPKVLSQKSTGVKKMFVEEKKEKELHTMVFEKELEKHINESDDKLVFIRTMNECLGMMYEDCMDYDNYHMFTKVVQQKYNDMVKNMDKEQELKWVKETREYLKKNVRENAWADMFIFNDKYIHDIMRVVDVVHCIHTKKKINAKKENQMCDLYKSLENQMQEREKHLQAYRTANELVRKNMQVFCDKYDQTILDMFNASMNKLKKGDQVWIIKVLDLWNKDEKYGEYKLTKKPIRSIDYGHMKEDGKKQSIVYMTDDQDRVWTNETTDGVTFLECEPLDDMGFIPVNLTGDPEMDMMLIKMYAGVKSIVVFV